MKNATLMTALLLSGLWVSCQSDSLKTHQDTLDMIAADPVYNEYQLLVYENMNHILMSEYDLESIGKVLSQYPDIQNICDMPDIALADIRGGLLYKDAQCRLTRAMAKFHMKYPDHFKKRSKADIKYLMDKWNELNGYKEQMINQQHFKMRIDGNK